MGKTYRSSGYPESAKPSPRIRRRDTAEAHLEIARGLALLSKVAQPTEEESSAMSLEPAFVPAKRALEPESWMDYRRNQRLDILQVIVEQSLREDRVET